MSILNIFNREYKLSDNCFSKLNMVEAKLCDWVCLESPNEASSVMHDILGLNWRKLPFKSIGEVLEFRFGDKFIELDTAFDYKSFSVLHHLGKNLNSDQREFLRKYNFLPHKYTSLIEELEIINRTRIAKKISMEEYVNSSQDKLVKETKLEIETLNSRQTKLLEDKKAWEKKNPSGINSAEASEYLSTYIELREWEENNKLHVESKSRMFKVMTNLMISALEQTKDSKLSYTQEFGHDKERKRLERIGQKNKSLGLQKNKESNIAPSKMSTVSSKKLSFKVENDKKLKDPLVENADAKVKDFLTDYDDSKVEYRQKPFLKDLKKDDPLDDYDRIQKKVLEMKSNKKEKSSNIVIKFAISSLVFLILIYLIFSTI